MSGLSTRHVLAAGPYLLQKGWNWWSTADYKDEQQVRPKDSPRPPMQFPLGTRDPCLTSGEKVLPIR